MAEFSRQSLAGSIDAVRAARDSLARSAAALREHNAIGLADTLDDLAAAQDRDLAVLLREDAKLTQKAGLLPGATSGRPPAN